MEISRNGVRDEVHNQIRLGILQNKGMADDAICQFLRQERGAGSIKSAAWSSAADRRGIPRSP